MSHFLKAEDIREGSVWTSCDGAGIRVRVQAVSNEVVEYLDLGDKIVRTKEAWAFQVRYYQVEVSK